MKNILKEVWSEMSKKVKIFLIFIFLLSFAVGIVGLTACSFLRELGDDNPVEEAIEEEIKNEMGIDIDLTPDSPEKNRY